MLRVSGRTEKIRRTNLSKLMNSWEGQVFELSDATVRVIRGPKYAKRYHTWWLEETDKVAGSFPMFNVDSDSALHESGAVNVQEPDDPSNRAVGKGRCAQCGNPLLPDESGSVCSD